MSRRAPPRSPVLSVPSKTRHPAGSGAAPAALVGAQLPCLRPGPAAAPALSLYTGLPRAGGRETCRAGDSFAGLPPTRRLLCTSESAGAWEVFSFSFLAGAFTATALAVINFATTAMTGALICTLRAPAALITASLAALTASYLFGIILDIDPKQN